MADAPSAGDVRAVLIDVRAKRLRIGSDEVDDLLRRLRRSRMPASPAVRAKIEKALRSVREADIVVLDQRDADVLSRVLARPPCPRGELLTLRTEIELLFHARAARRW